MEEQRTDAPELDLSSIADEDGDDALQVTLSDSVAGMQLADPFSIDSSSPKIPPEPVAAKAAAEPQKPHRPNVQLGDDRFVAALLGRPMDPPKKSKLPKAAKAKPAAIAASPVDVPKPIEELPPEPAMAAVVEVEPTPIIEPAIVLPQEPPVSLASAPDVVEAAPIVAAPLPTPTAAAASLIEKPKPIRSTPRATGPMSATAPVTVIAPEIPLEPLAPTPTAVLITPPNDSEAKPVTTQSKIIPVIDPAAQSTEAEAAPMAKPIVSSPVMKSSTVPFEKPAAPAPALEVESEPLPPVIDEAALARDFALPKPPRPAIAPPAKTKPVHQRPHPLRNPQASTAAQSMASSASLKAIRPLTVAPAVEEFPRAATGAWWTLPLMFVGILMIACALIVPEVDENHRAAYELAKIERDVVHFQSQSDTNQSFLNRVSTDPALAERLAMRQLNMIRPDEHFAPLKAHHDAFSMSPFALVSVDPPAPLPAYRPIGGFLSRWFLSPRFQIYFVGLGLLLTAAGVVFGGGNKPARQDPQPA